LGEKLKKAFLIFILTSILLLQSVKADVGVGIQWGVEEIFVNDNQENCLSYKIYNPFNSDVTATVSVSDDLIKYISSVEPEQVFLSGYQGDPNDNAAKLANSKNVEVCFNGNIWRWPPFYPIDLEGGVLAGSSPGNVVGITGSTVASVVHAPLTLHVGSLSNYYKFVVILVVVLILLAIVILKIMKKLPKSKKKYCKKCKKKFSSKTKFCPSCGKKL
jgi:hypothetical protein